MQRPDTHGYSVSKGIPRLRSAICNWYKTRYDVELDPDSEAIVTIGSKEGIAHLALATLDRGDIVLVPNPSYPIHIYGPVIAGADIHHVPMHAGRRFLRGAGDARSATRYPKPKMLIVNFPSNPTTQCVDLAFFERLVAIAREHHIYVVHDLAYADIVFDGYKAPSIMQVPGAREIAVEFFTMSKSYNMAGWRVGFMVGNRELVTALARMKSYHDYGTFTPIQVASIIALEGPQDCVEEVRSALPEAPRRAVQRAAGGGLECGDAARRRCTSGRRFRSRTKRMGSLEFSKKLLIDAKVAVAPGIGFGHYGDGHVRFALIENEARTRQARARHQGHVPQGRTAVRSAMRVKADQRRTARHRHGRRRHVHRARAQPGRDRAARRLRASR